MNRIPAPKLCTTLVAPVIATLLSAITLAAADERQQLFIAAKSMPLQTFMSFVTSNQWRCPTIHSKWFVARMGQSDEALAAEGARAFGMDVAGRIEKCGALLKGSTNSQERFETTRLLFDLADWLTAQTGYENVLLGAKCQDTASIGLGRLIVDLSFPSGSLSSLVARFDAPWHLPRVRAAVLNGEVGTNVFVVTTDDVSAGQTSLQQAWKNGAMLYLKTQHPEIAPVFHGEKVHGFEALSEMIEASGFKLVETPVFTNNVGFFGNKDFERIVNGFGSPRYLVALFTFRVAVGNFPEKPTFTPEQQAAEKAEIEAAAKRGIKIVPTSAMYSSPGEEAFAQAWKPHARKDTWNLYAAAWKAYQEIKASNSH